MTDHTQQTTIGGDEKDLSKADMMRLTEDAFRNSAKEAEKADKSSNGQPQKVFGFEVDPAAAGVIKGVYNTAGMFANKMLAPKTYNLAKGIAGDHLGMNKTSAAKTAAIATFGVNVAVKSGGYFVTAAQAMMDQRKRYADLARKLAPVLDDEKGQHSFSALMAVKENDNAMIYAHRKRMTKVAHAENMNNVWDIVINAGTSLLFDIGQLSGMWGGSTPKELAVAAKAKKAAGDEGSAKDMMEVLWNNSSSQIARIMAHGNQRKIDEVKRTSSALELVFALEEGVTNNPQAKLFYPPGNKSKGMTLEQYIVTVMVQYQKDLADINPEQSEIRETLMEDLSLAAAPLAKAIRSGDISALALVKLIGEGHIIKSHGRVIVSAEEVEALVERTEGKVEQKVHQSPKDFYAVRGYDKKQLQDSLKHLEGDERALFVAWHSDEVLEDAGMSGAEIKKTRAEMADHYANMTLDAFLGVASKSEDELRAEGLPSAEIRMLMDGKKRLDKLGVDGFATLLESPSNAHGIEGPLSDLIVSNVVGGDKEYLGKVIEIGKEERVKFERKASVANDNERVANDNERTAKDNHHAVREREETKPESHAGRAAAERADKLQAEKSHASRNK